MQGTASGATLVRAAGAARWLLVGFLLVWLAGWTTGIWVAVGALVQNGAEDLALAAFLGVWVAFAAVGWVVVVGVLIRLLAGHPLPPAEPD